MKLPHARPVLLRLAPYAAAFALATGILAVAGVSPLHTWLLVLRGALGSPRAVADVLVVWAPLLIAAAGLRVTFAAGLWNIGIEGQIVAGAIAATGILRALGSATLPPGISLTAALLAGLGGGAAWAAFAAALKNQGRIHEIFGGLGLNYVAAGLAMGLIFGPWKRPGIASMSGTQMFPETLWLPTFEGLRLCPLSLALAGLALALTHALLAGTSFGLRLRAAGLNPRAALHLGIPTSRGFLAALAISGALGGLAGALQVLAVYHRLIPGISAGYGFLALLVVLLAGRSTVALPAVAFFFALLQIGSIQLPIELHLDSSLAGVLQGALVLFALLAEGIRRRWPPGDPSWTPTH